MACVVRLKEANNHQMADPDHLCMAGPSHSPQDNLLFLPESGRRRHPSSPLTNTHSSHFLLFLPEFNLSHTPFLDFGFFVLLLFTLATGATVTRQRGRENRTAKIQIRVLAYS